LLDIALRRANEAARALPPAPEEPVLAGVDCDDAEVALMLAPLDAPALLPVAFIADLPPVDKALRRCSAIARLLFGFAIATCDMFIPPFLFVKSLLDKLSFTKKSHHRIPCTFRS
jgi:hypothetical protein